MVDNMSKIRKNASKKIYKPLITFRRSFKFSKKNYFFKKMISLKRANTLLFSDE